MFGQIFLRVFGQSKIFSGAFSAPPQPHPPTPPWTPPPLEAKLCPPPRPPQDAAPTPDADADADLHQLAAQVIDWLQHFCIVLLPKSAVCALFIASIHSAPSDPEVGCGGLPPALPLRTSVSALVYVTLLLNINWAARPGTWTMAALCVYPALCMCVIYVYQFAVIVYPDHLRRSVHEAVCAEGAGGGGGGGGVWAAQTVKRPPQQPAHPPIRQSLGAADTQTAHLATSRTAPAHQLLGSVNAQTTPAGAPAAAADRTQRPDATCEGKNG